MIRTVLFFLAVLMVYGLVGTLDRESEMEARYRAAMVQRAAVIASLR